MTLSEFQKQHQDAISFMSEGAYHRAAELLKPLVPVLRDQIVACEHEKQESLCTANLDTSDPQEPRKKSKPELKLTWKAAPQDTSRSFFVNLYGSLLNSLGICFYELRDLNSAMKCLQEALRSLDPETGMRGIGAILHEMARVQQDLGNLPAAIELCKGAIRATTSDGSEATVALLTLGVLYIVSGQREKAQAVLTLLRETCESRHDLGKLGSALHELAILSSHRGNGLEAAGFFVKAMRVKRLAGNITAVEGSRAALKQCVSIHPEARLHPLIHDPFTTM